MNQPSAPDPYATAAAQTKQNQDTANYQQSLNMVDQNTPYGGVKYKQTGVDPNTGAPRYEADTTLSPELQRLVGQNITNANDTSSLENTLLHNSQNQLSKPLDLSWSNTEQQINDLNRHTMDPQWAKNQQDFEQQAANKGWTPGSQAYNQGYQNFNTARSNAYDAMTLAAHQQAVSDLTQQYNSPLNALTALRGNTQINQPGIGQTAATPQTGVQNTDLAGLINQNYQNQLQQSNSAMGGLFGLGGSLLKFGLGGL